jgi:hypothetical protein
MSEVRGIVRVNGQVEPDQFLTANLDYFIVDEVDGAANIASFGYDGSGDPNPGEEVIQALQTVANPVIIESGNARVMYVAVEIDGVSATDMANAINSRAAFANATVTAGSFLVA